MNIEIPEKPIFEEPKTYEQYCIIKDFLEGINLQKNTLKSTDFHDLSAKKITFESLVNKNIKTKS